jgi:hypothetical protein
MSPRWFSEVCKFGPLGRWNYYVAMNLNALEHQPLVAQDLTAVEFAQEKMLSDPDRIITEILNRCKKALLGNSSSR